MDISASGCMKIIFAVHFTLITIGIQGFWSPDSYFFYNLIFILTLLWSIHCKDNEEPLQIAVAVNFISIFLDVITLSTSYPSSSIISGERFSAAIAIINLIIRPVSLFYMIRLTNQRMGFENIFSSASTSSPSGARNTYEDIGN